LPLSAASNNVPSTNRARGDYEQKHDPRYRFSTSALTLVFTTLSLDVSNDVSFIEKVSSTIIGNKLLRFSTRFVGFFDNQTLVAPKFIISCISLSTHCVFLY
jgi:hypothetical protein